VRLRQTLTAGRQGTSLPASRIQALGVGPSSSP